MGPAKLERSEIDGPPGAKSKWHEYRITCAHRASVQQTIRLPAEDPR